MKMINLIAKAIFLKQRILRLRIPLIFFQSCLVRDSKIKFLFPLVFICFTYSAGCSLGVPKSQYLSMALSDYFYVKASAEQVWQVLSEETKAYGDCLLVKEKNYGVISWCEKVENWRDLGQDTVGPGANYHKLAQKPGQGTAVTTVMIESLDSGTKIYIRRVYYGKESFSGVGDSRGDYEHDLYQRILDRLKES